MAKATTTRAAPAKAPAKRTRAKSAAVREQEAAIEAQAVSMASAPDPQSGGVMVQTEDLPTPKQVKKAREAAQAEQFAAADEKGAPTAEQLADTRLSLAVRGY